MSSVATLRFASGFLGGIRYRLNRHVRNGWKADSSPTPQSGGACSTAWFMMHRIREVMTDDGSPHDAPGMVGAPAPYRKRLAETGMRSLHPPARTRADLASVTSVMRCGCHRQSCGELLQAVRLRQYADAGRFGLACRGLSVAAR